MSSEDRMRRLGVDPMWSPEQQSRHLADVRESALAALESARLANLEKLAARRQPVSYDPPKV